MNWTSQQLHKFCLLETEADILKYCAITEAISKSKLYPEWKQFGVLVQIYINGERIR